ncbi:hypothetical protein N0V83_001518 [Neocucurbitaria cava]|uniref:Uncharacterized protein n=1 Tax=Neocucurbitaria cava TaxID=798079 RepID=A0A9W8YFV2_9PLEO|nr:hypothetical protein N0V83_001518 [Neocucurbitaria cava]
MFCHAALYLLCNTHPADTGPEITIDHPVLYHPDDLGIPKMSQPSTPFVGVAVDPMLLSMEQQQHFTQYPSGSTFGSNELGQIPFPSTNSEVPDDHDFTYNNYTPVHSSNPSTISTPDFSTYSFGQMSPAYPTPGYNFPHPYPYELQQSYQSSVPQNIPTYEQRPLPFRSHTNITPDQPTQTPQTYVRRRSLSHGDADRLASAPPNPTFVRLQASRPTSTTPENTKKAGPYSKHGRSASHGLSVRGRPLKPSGIPYVLGGNPLIGGMMSTPIGTPLDMLREPVSPARNNNDTRYDSARGPPNKRNDIIFEHMTHPNDLARSRQIIQIGAMAVVQRSRIDPRLVVQENNQGNQKEHILKKLQDVQEHLQENKSEDEHVLNACSVLRGALTQKTGVVNTNNNKNNSLKPKEKEEESEGDHDDDADDLETPSKVLSPEDCGLYGGAGGDTDLLALLRTEHTPVDDSGVDDL